MLGIVWGTLVSSRYVGALVNLFLAKNFNDKQYSGPLTAVPMVSLTVLPNCPCFYR